MVFRNGVRTGWSNIATCFARPYPLRWELLENLETWMITERFKVHLTPIFFFSLNRIFLLFEEFGRKSFWICLNPRFSMPSQSCAWSVARPRFRESGAAVADDVRVFPGTKHNGASVCSLYLLDKMVSKINRSNIFWDWSVRVLFHRWSQS